MKFKALLCAFLLLDAPSLFAFALEGESWTLDRTVVMQLSLGAPRVLSDGFASFNESAQDALNIWNQHLVHLQFRSVLDSPVSVEAGDDEMSVVFASDIFGDTFGDEVLAVTLLNFRDKTFEESETLFNSAFTWDSYNGPLRGNVFDFHRVALHEFGHTLGLDHPDENGEKIAAIMNSHVSDLDALQPDDIAGVESLYNEGPEYQNGVPAPVLANLSTRGFIGTGDNILIGGFIIEGPEPATVVLRAIGHSLAENGIENSLFDPTITLFDSNQRQIGFNDDWAFAGTAAETVSSFHLDPPNSRESVLYVVLDPGSYTAIVEGFSGPGQPQGTGLGLFELYDLHTTGGRAINISTRGQVLGDDNILIGGFIVGGDQTKTIVARAIGPSLSAAGIANPLPDPNLELRDSNGDLLQANNDWGQGLNADEITADGLAPANAKESALRATLMPGAYTALMSGVNGATGIGLVEIYDLDP